MSRTNSLPMRGVILCGVGGFYTVRDEAGDLYTLRAQNKLRRARQTPLVGDWVQFQPGEGEQHGWLEAIEPRRNQLVRPPVANIDRICVVVSAGSPQADLSLVDTLLMQTRAAKIETALVVNKADEDPELAEYLYRQYERAGVERYITCASSGEGIEQLAQSLRGKVHALGGQSGVGKSTLINRLYGTELKTGGLSEKIGRGKHTTRHCQLIPLPDGGMVLDTPGFSLLELERMEPIKLLECMPEFEEYEGKCRFSPCAHITEPGCAVREAIENGEISRERWERYAALYEDMNRRWKERYD